jgi:copper resistance protein D
MDDALAVARALHFAAAIVLFGELAFAQIASPARASPRHAGAIIGASLAVAALSALAWLAIEAAVMSGLPLREALAAETLRTVLAQTFFGRLWLARLLLLVAIAVFAWRAPRLTFALSALWLATLAGLGHAAAGRGIEREMHLAVDALHLLAAGTWLGMLWPLARTLGAAGGSAAVLHHARETTRRFSLAGVASVGALVLTGLASVSFHAVTFDAHGVTDLLDSEYGRILAVKLGFFAAMVALAAVNRVSLTPRLVDEAHPSLQALRRNALAELALGLAVVSLAGKLGITMPPAPHHHEHHHAKASAGVSLRS